MKKIYSIILLIFCVVSTSWGQGINFISSYKEALEKAAKEGKHVFIDFYTQWCGPCKVMEKEIFPRRDVGTYFNQNFIALKMDAETPEGRELAKKFNISSFPTFVFLNYQGDFLGKDTGTKNNFELIKLAQNCTDSTLDTVNRMRVKFEANQMNREEVFEYIETLRKFKLSALQPLEYWMKMLSEGELYSAATFREIRKEDLGPGDYPFDFLLEHYDQYAEVVDKVGLDQFLYINCMFLYFQNTRINIDNNSFTKKLEECKIYFVPALEEELDLVEHVLPDPKRDEELINRTQKLISSYPVAGYSIGNEILKRAYGRRQQLEMYMDTLALRVFEYNPKSAAGLALCYAGIFSDHAGEFEKANLWIDRYIKWGGDPEARKDYILYIKRTLGLEKCADYGKEMYNFTLPDIKGKKVSLADFRGKYVLLDFWASWCDPCRKELPNLKKITKKYKPKDLVIISISCDKKEKDWKEAVDKEGMTWVQLTADGSKVYDEYGVSGIPRIMLLDKKGRLAADGLRGKYIEQAIEREMK